MSRTYGLQDEDRPDYALVLDEALRTPEIRGLLAHSAVSPGQLRNRGLGAARRITGAADTEYRTYASLRQQTRVAGRAERVEPLSGPGDQEEHGVGVLPVLAVLTPLLAGVAAAAFLLIGYGLGLAGSRTPTAGTLITAGWTSFGICAVSASAGLFSLYRTAAAHTASAPAPPAARPPAVDRAREAWLVSLRDRAVLPFLRDQLRGPDAPAAAGGREAGPRYGRPDFSSPGFGSPDFAGPGLGGANAPAERD